MSFSPEHSKSKVEISNALVILQKWKIYFEGTTGSQFKIEDLSEAEIALNNLCINLREIVPEEIIDSLEEAYGYSCDIIVKISDKRETHKVYANAKFLSRQLETLITNISNLMIVISLSDLPFEVFSKTFS